jgi:hypothetical protein
MAGVRGYADWKPKADAVHWIRRTLDVAEQYRDYWPLSVRQVFYRLVADHGYEKTEAAYNRLTQIISRSRRAGLIPWDAIRDGGLGRTVEPHFFDDGPDFEKTVRRAAETMKLNRQAGQKQVVELWCEAGGMVPILEGIADPYSAQVNTGGGYDSVTAKHNLAERVRDRARDGKATIILHVGDFDASGEDMCNVLREDAQMMVVAQIARAASETTGGGWAWKDVPDFVEEWRASGGDTGPVGQWAWDFFSVERVALTGEQVIERQVETAPPKPSDSRTTAFVERNEWVADELGTTQITAQLEALTPPELEELISGAIEAHLDMDVYEELLDEEQEVRRDLLERLDGRGT